MSSSLAKVKKIFCFYSWPEAGDAPAGISILRGSSYFLMSDSEGCQMNGTYSLAKNYLV
jgi:hypothetical protein|tara:strand:- start:1416 stop:1592 length:177 start_codon:yes stop_codon:yes gene_type:complete